MRSGLAIAILAAAAAALAIVVWRLGFPLTNDGPAHLFGAYASAHIDEPLFAPFLAANEHLTNRGVPELYALFDGLGWRTGFRATTLAIVLAAGAATATVVVAAGP